MKAKLGQVGVSDTGTGLNRELTGPFGVLGSLGQRVLDQPELAQKGIVTKESTHLGAELGSTRLPLRCVKASGEGADRKC
jgi:hypothetical protein